MTTSKPKTSTAKRPAAKSPAAARKASTAARSATARSKTAAAAQVEDEGGEAIAGRVIPGPVIDVETGGTEARVTAPLADPDARSTYHRPDRAGLEVSPGLSFTSTTKDRDAEGYGERRVFEVDGELYVMVRPIDDAFVLLTTAAAATTPMADRVAAIMEFLAEAVDEGDQIRLRNRLKDPTDDFGFLDLLDVLERVVETFTKNKGPKQARAMAAPARR